MIVSKELYFPIVSLSLGIVVSTILMQVKIVVRRILGMQKPKTKIQKMLSFNQHRKRFGASKVISDIHNTEWQAMKKCIISGDTAKHTHGADKNLQQHTENLKKEFVGQPELNYHHAILILLIRRDVDVHKHFLQFQQLWLQEHDFLLKSLNTRWLISACDTFIDHSKDDFLKALLMNAVTLVNTIKLQESERYLTVSDTAKPDPKRHDSLQNERLTLFDGIAGFAVGTDDTLRNMRWRLDKISQSHPLGDLVIEIFERVQKPESDTVYSRFRALHHRDKTAWWTE